MQLTYENCDKMELSPMGRFLKRNRDNAHYAITDCEICNEPFFNLRGSSRFCTRKCQGVWRSRIQKGSNNAKWKGGDVAFFCKECGSKFQRRRGQENGACFCSRKCHCEWQSKYRRGSNSHAWRGGLSSKPYCFIWNLVEGKELKKNILERDGYQCLNPLCNKKTKRLFVHHINYNKALCGPDNLISLCNGCNSSANYNRQWHTEWYQLILKKRYGYQYECRKN